MLLMDLVGKELTIEEQELLEHPFVSGLILFTRNFYDREQIQALVKSIRQRVKKPLLITIDQEGGRVQRFREGFTQLPAMQSFQQLIQDPEIQQKYAHEAGWLMAAEMFALDIDLSFAPVLDLGHQSKAIGDRSFGKNIEQILPIAESFIDGMQEMGMATTGKHFPGHGHVIADSHLETPIDERSKDAIFSQDIQPFKQLIAKNKLDAIMPAHVIYTQCDAQPASGSSYWLKEILRKQLQFNGVIFSDDLGMKGAGFMGDYVERSQKALAAGCDLLLLCNEPEGVVQVLDNLNYQTTPEQKIIHQKLMKRKQIRWQDLVVTERWKKAHQQLEALQNDWLEWKANHA
ncbi:beta-N-acetylhexosaminidase [Otariodibacter oris]|uniref:Beta-hexosaminidase n=1 Tax=Otariodibacter oris TaxID=1032623 RepID=A0A420XHK7_9PAST|nr:beta-N-acetylhexosaminidase [Otariodibacter oris]QGM80988.1 beta-N-acetylhexosaminidase [Otariodibacter oris]RKR76832.1 beta-N-acetylhexosaminidase [Otariodibacter oris]